MEEHKDNPKSQETQRAQASSFQAIRTLSEMPQQQNDPENSANIIKAQLMDTIFHGQANDFLRSRIKPDYIKKMEDVRRLVGAEGLETMANNFTENDLKRFQNMRSMSELRSRATHLFDQYNNDAMKDHSTKQAWYTRQAWQIWKSAGELVDKYLKYKNGKVEIKGLNMPTIEMLRDIEQQLPEAYAISKEIEKSYSKNPEVTIPFPIEKPEKRRWDSDSVTMDFDEESNIQRVHFDEFFDFSNPGNLSELANAYKTGEKLSPSQVQLLADHNLIPSSDIIHTEGIVKIPQQKGTTSVEPIFILGYVLPDDLKEKTKGLWARSENFQQGIDETFQLDAGEMTITTHEHDHSPGIESHATLDARTLSKEDIYRLIGTYIDVLRAFPRVKKFRVSLKSIVRSSGLKI